MRKRRIILALIGLGWLALWTGPGAAARPARTPPRYLLFYLSGGKPALMGVPASIETRAHTEGAVDEVIRAVGGTGDHVRTQLGFSVGPLMFDLSDDQLRQLIADSFLVAEKKNVAVAFHIDDSMFWNARRDLWSDKNNVEWTDWSGTTRPHRIIGWVAGGKPLLAPQMCFNSPAIRAEATRLAREIIGPAVKKGADRLKALGKPYLFVGVIAGWETRLQDDSSKSAEDSEYGFCALRNLGFSAQKPPADRDSALEGVVAAWISLWAKGLVEAGLPETAIYTHSAFPQATAFNRYSRPGFSVYGADGFLPLHQLLARHPGIPWGVSEGTNVDLADAFSGANAQSRSSMERYLAEAFNHGAAMVNLYGWSTAQEPDEFGRATAGPAAVAAYRKFLSGAKLSEGAPTPPSLRSDLPSKIRRIQAELPPWMRDHPGQRPAVEALMPRLDAAMRADDVPQAEKTADEILRLIESS